MIKGKIRWFDSLSGEGMVRSETGQSYFLHFTAITNVSKNNHQWPDQKDLDFLNTIKDRECVFEIIEDTTFEQVVTLTIV